MDTEGDKSFVQGLLNLANLLRQDLDFKKTFDIKKAAVLVSVDIVSKARSGIGPLSVEGSCSISEASKGAVFLCFVTSPIISFLKREGINLSINDLFLEAGLPLYQFYSIDNATKILEEGVQQYKILIKESTGKELENVKEYSQNMDQLVYLYVMTADERLIKGFHQMFKTLFDA